jgi:DNA-binding MarR family transcriptional regulator
VDGSKDRPLSRPQFEYAQDVVALLRAYVIESSRYGDVYAASVGMHPTDMNALAVLHQAQAEGVHLTPGELGRALSLSSPATSAMLARLEEAGRISRATDELDRRRVVITAEPSSIEEASGYFEPLGDAILASFEPLGPAERAVVVGFLERLVRATECLGGSTPEGMGPNASP